MTTVASISSSQLGSGTRRIRPVRVVVAVSSRVRERLFGRSRIFSADLPLEIAWVEPPEGDVREWLDLLNKLEPEVLVSGWGTPRLPDTWLENGSCPLRYVCHAAGSVRPIVPRSFLERGGRVSNWGALVARPVAEHALLLALAALRELPAWRAHLQRSADERSLAPLATRSLTGKRVGLHGFGGIARELVALLRPFRVEIGAYAPGVPQETMRDLGVEPCERLADLCARSDVFFECEALTPGTAGSFSATAIQSLPMDAVFVNVGRGGVVDEEALLEAAKDRRVRVALDVVAEEPIATDSPWLRLENVLIAPHIGGPTLDETAEIGERVARNVQNYLERKPLEGEVTLEVYDRST